MNELLKEESSMVFMGGSIRANLLLADLVVFEVISTMSIRRGRWYEGETICLHSRGSSPQGSQKFGPSGHVLDQKELRFKAALKG